MYELESTVNAEPVVNVEPQEVVEPTEPTEEVTAEPTEEVESVESGEGEVATPKQTKEQNSEYAKIRREAEQRAKEKAIAEYNQQIATLYGEYGIKSLDDLKVSVEQQRKQAQMDELLERGYTQSEVDEILEAREIMREKKERDAKEAQEQALTQMVNEFNTTFPGVDIASLPKEVIDLYQSGKDLVSAYALYQVKNIDKLKAEAQQEAIKALKENADTSPGSLSGTGGEEGKMTVDQVDKMLLSMTSKERSAWLDKNYNNLEKWGYFKT